MSFLGNRFKASGLPNIRLVNKIRNVKKNIKSISSVSLISGSFSTTFHHHHHNKTDSLDFFLSNLHFFAITIALKHQEN